MKKWMKAYFGIEMLRALFGVAILATAAFAGPMDTTKTTWDWGKIWHLPAKDSLLVNPIKGNYRVEYFKVVQTDSVLGVVVEKTVWGHIENEADVADSVTYRVMSGQSTLFAGKLPEIYQNMDVDTLQWFQGEKLMIQNYKANEMDWKSYIVED